MTDFDTNQYEPVRFTIPSQQKPLGTIYREGAYFNSLHHLSTSNSANLRWKWYLPTELLLRPPAMPGNLNSHKKLNTPDNYEM